MAFLDSPRYQIDRGLVNSMFIVSIVYVQTALLGTKTRSQTYTFYFTHAHLSYCTFFSEASLQQVPCRNRLLHAASTVSVVNQARQ